MITQRSFLKIANVTHNFRVMTLNILPFLSFFFYYYFYFFLFFVTMNAGLEKSYYVMYPVCSDLTAFENLVLKLVWRK